MRLKTVGGRAFFGGEADVRVIDMRSEQGVALASRYDVRRVPAVVVEGQPPEGERALRRPPEEEGGE